MTSRVGLKVDVDTLEGYRQGVPALLGQLGKAGVRGSFFFAVGPDRSGVAVRRLFTQRGFLGKMIRNRAPATFGWRTMLYGTLLPAPPIVAADPGIVRAVADAGHEVGVHGWDHIGWHDRLGRMSAEAVREQLDRAYGQLGEALGREPDCFAAPGWQCAPASLADHDRRALRYASDVRGAAAAFRPRLGGTVYHTPQLSTNVPTLDELWGLEVQRPAEAADYWLQYLSGDDDVLTVHTEIEGMALPEALPRFLEQAAERGLSCCPLGELIEGTKAADLPIREVRRGRLRGRAGWVWVVEGERAKAG